MHNTVNNSYRLSVVAYIQAIIRPTLSRTYKKESHTIAHILTWKRDLTHFTQTL